MNKNFVLILLVLLITISSSFGQSDYRDGFIITLENDTIHGQLDYRSNAKNYETCLFKGERGETVYYPIQILGFGYNNDKFFASQIVENAFVEVLIVGDINLYKSKDRFHVKKDTLFFDLESIIEEEEINGQIKSTERSKWRGILTYLIGDCLQNASSHTSNIKLNEKSLSRLILKYNKCKGTDYTEFKADIPWTDFEFGATTGVTLSQINTTSGNTQLVYMDESYTSIDPTIGVILGVSFPRVSEKVIFESEIHLIKSSYSALVKEEGAATKFHDTFIDLTTLSFPISCKYSFPEKKYGLYLQAGLNYDQHLSSDTRLLSETIIGNVVSTSPESPAFDTNSSQLGFWGGVGILKTYQKFRGSVALRYFQMIALNQTDAMAANNRPIINNNRISVNLILFKK